MSSATPEKEKLVIKPVRKEPKRLPPGPRNKDLPWKTPTKAIGYYWMPAATDEVSCFRNIAVLEQKNTVFGSRRIKEQNGKKAHMVFVMKNPTQTVWASAKPLPESVLNKPGVKLYDFGLNDGRAYLSDNVKFAMYNASTASNKHMDVRDRIRKCTYVVQDSGGFQLFVGKTDFLSPTEIVQRHNQYADVGVGLDIPGYGITDSKIIDATAKVLAANNTEMVKSKHPKLKLMNVSHGMNIEQRIRYLEIVMAEEPLDSLCIGSVKTNMGERPMNPERFIGHLLATILVSDKVYHHYHVLGIGTRWQIALLALAAVKFKKLITSDSANYAKTAFNGQYLAYGYSNFPLGKSLGDHPSHMPLRCWCPACSVFKYVETYRSASELTIAHNFWSAAQTAKDYNEMAHADPEGRWILTEVPYLEALKIRMRRALTVLHETNSLADLHRIHKGKAEHSRLGLFSGGEEDRRIQIIRNYENHHGRTFYKK